MESFWEAIGAQNISENLELRDVMSSWITQNGYPVVFVNRNYASGSATINQVCQFLFDLLSLYLFIHSFSNLGFILLPYYPTLPIYPTSYLPYPLTIPKTPPTYPTQTSWPNNLPTNLPMYPNHLTYPSWLPTFLNTCNSHQPYPPFVPTYPTQLPYPPIPSTFLILRYPLPITKYPTHISYPLSPSTFPTT